MKTQRCSAGGLGLPTVLLLFVSSGFGGTIIGGSPDPGVGTAIADGGAGDAGSAFGSVPADDSHDATVADAGPADAGPGDAMCEPSCPPDACGDDGCGGSCAECPEAGRPIWFSGFERGWPGGEWNSYPPSAPMVEQGLGALWDIVETDDAVEPIEGDYMYKGWITEAVPDSHRAYPVLHGDEQYAPETYIVNRFYVWADVELTGKQWFHFATWASNADWIVWTMSIRRGSDDDYRVWVNHLWNGGAAEVISPRANVYPLRQWVRFTKYIDFSGDGYMRLWMDGVPIIEGTGDPITQYDDWLLRAHWGVYGSGEIPEGVQYNDSIQIWALDEPLGDLETEPRSPYDGTGVITPGERGRLSVACEGTGKAGKGDAHLFHDDR